MIFIYFLLLFVLFYVHECDFVGMIDGKEQNTQWFHRYDAQMYKLVCHVLLACRLGSVGGVDNGHTG
jgi:hypothetical protein